MASFSSLSFSEDAFSVLAFDFGDGPAPVTPSKGGFDDERYYKKYREHLNRLEEITRFKEITPTAIIEAKEIVEEIKSIEPTETKADFVPDFVFIEHQAIQAQLLFDRALLLYQKQLELQREAEDELIIMLMV